MKTGEKTLNEVMILKSTKFKRQAEQIMKIAEENGVQGNFLFATTFDRYLFLIETLENLKEKIKDEGLTVEKEYVKGKKNSYSSPCVKNYNTTCDLANKTVQTLMRVIRDFNVEEDKGEVDPLIRMINGERSE